MSELTKKLRERVEQMRADLVPIMGETDPGMRAFAWVIEQIDELLTAEPQKQAGGPRAQVSKRLGAQRGVYILRAAERGLVKIGFATDTRKRVQGLKTMSPTPLELVGIRYGAGRDHEQELHGRYAEYRAHGEWFREEGRLAEFCQLVESGALEDPNEAERA